MRFSRNPGATGKPAPALGKHTEGMPRTPVRMKRGSRGNIIHAMASIPLFPLQTTLFPGGLLPLRIFEVRYLDLIKKCIADETQFGVVALLSGSEVRTPQGGEVLAGHGTMARIDAWDAPMPGLLHVKCSGTARFALSASEMGKYGLWHGEATELAADPSAPIPAAMQAAADRLGRLITELQKSRVPAGEMPMSRPYRLDECGWVANRWGELLPLPTAEKQLLLAMDDPVARLAWVHDYLSSRNLLS